MADYKVELLTKRVVNSLANITGVRLWSGKTGDANGKAQGVELSELANSAVVAAGSEVDYNFLTPKGFALSVATDERKGIVEKAIDAELLANTADKYISADHQPQMQENWSIADATHGKPKIYTKSALGGVYSLSICFEVVQTDPGTVYYHPFPFTHLVSVFTVQALATSTVYGVQSRYETKESVGGGYALTFGGTNFQMFFQPAAAPYIACTGAGTYKVAMEILILG